MGYVDKDSFNELCHYVVIIRAGRTYLAASKCEVISFFVNGKTITRFAIK